MAKRALVVDDSVSTRFVVKAELQSIGYNADEAEGAETALELLSKNEYNIILTDLHMPGISGLELIKRIRAIHNHKFTPILLVTTEGKESFKSEAKKLGATGWITKPFDPEKLKLTVKRLAG